MCWPHEVCAATPAAVGNCLRLLRLHGGACMWEGSRGGGGFVAQYPCTLFIFFGIPGGGGLPTLCFCALPDQTAVATSRHHVLLLFLHMRCSSSSAPAGLGCAHVHGSFMTGSQCLAFDRSCLCEARDVCPTRLQHLERCRLHTRMPLASAAGRTGTVVGGL